MVFVSGLTESGMKIDKKDQTEHHKKMFELSDKLVKELKESDVIIISAPIYNYGPPATLKAWSDLAARVGETFKFKPDGRREGLLKNKRAYLVITSGGTKLNSKDELLDKECFSLEMTKKGFLYLFNEALSVFQQDLQHEQQSQNCLLT